MKWSAGPKPQSASELGLCTRPTSASSAPSEPGPAQAKQLGAIYCCSRQVPQGTWRLQRTAAPSSRALLPWVLAQRRGCAARRRRCRLPPALYLRP